MKKLIALVSAAAVLVMPMAVCAAPSPSAGAVVAASTQSAQNSAVETAAAEVSMSVGEYTTMRLYLLQDSLLLTLCQ